MKFDIFWKIEGIPDDLELLWLPPILAGIELKIKTNLYPPTLRFLPCVFYPCVLCSEGKGVLN